MKIVIVIGSGASGLVASLTAAGDMNNKVLLFERQARVGRKLAATGNGRCNLTNLNCCPASYFGEEPGFASHAIESFGPEDTLEYFKSLGLLTSRQYGGRVYPLSDSANSVVDVLRFAVECSCIELHTTEPVTGISHKSGGFTVKTDNGQYLADRVIISCGGMAGGKLGGVKDGYELLKSLGHSCTKLHPALVPLTVEGELIRSLKGVRAGAKITLNGKTSEGEIQFTENGVSGPAVFDISREASLNGGRLKIDFLTGGVLPMIKRRRDEMPELEAQYLLTGMLHNRLASVMVKYCGIKPSQRIGELSDAELEKISRACSCFELDIKGTGNFDTAQITVGGIKTSEFRKDTLESRIVPGLFACGEVLDVDAPCGGFNLQWAWSSGRLAGRLGG